MDHPAICATIKQKHRCWANLVSSATKLLEELQPRIAKSFVICQNKALDGALNGLVSSVLLFLERNRRRIEGLPVPWRKLGWDDALDNLESAASPYLEELQRRIAKAPVRCTFSPWRFERKPNPVIFKHLSPSIPATMDLRWRHVPINLAYVSYDGDVETGEAQIKKRGEKDKEKHEVSLQVRTRAPVTSLKPPDNPVFTCSHCGLEFPTAGILKFVSPRTFDILIN